MTVMVFTTKKKLFYFAKKINFPTAYAATYILRIMVTI